MPQGGDAAHLRALLGESLAPGVDVFALRKNLMMTQRVFGAQFGVSRQQALHVYPVEGPHATAGIVLDRENARALATRLLILAEDGHDAIEVTVFRKPRKSDQTLPVRVTARRAKTMPVPKDMQSPRAGTTPNMSNSKH